MAVERDEIFSLSKLRQVGIEVQLSETFFVIAWITLDFCSEMAQLHFREYFLVLCNTKGRTYVEGVGEDDFEKSVKIWESEKPLWFYTALQQRWS